MKMCNKCAEREKQILNHIKKIYELVEEYQEIINDIEPELLIDSFIENDEIEINDTYMNEIIINGKKVKKDIYEEIKMIERITNTNVI